MEKKNVRSVCEHTRQSGAGRKKRREGDSFKKEAMSVGTGQERATVYISKESVR